MRTGNNSNNHINLVPQNKSQSHKVLIKDDTECENIKRREAKMSFEEIVYDKPVQIPTYFIKPEDVLILERRRHKPQPRLRSKTSKSVDRTKHSVLLNQPNDDNDVLII